MINISVQLNRYEVLKKRLPAQCKLVYPRYLKEDLKSYEEESKINRKNKDRLIVLLALVVEIILTYGVVINFYWFFLLKLPLNFIMGILQSLGMLFVSIYLAVILAIYISRRNILKSFKK